MSALVGLHAISLLAPTQRITEGGVLWDEGLWLRVHLGRSLNVIGEHSGSPSPGNSSSRTPRILSSLCATTSTRISPQRKFPPTHYSTHTPTRRLRHKRSSPFRLPHLPPSNPHPSITPTAPSHLPISIETTRAAVRWIDAIRVSGRSMGELVGVGGWRNGPETMSWLGTADNRDPG
jgi:hypothetical protein